MKLTGQATQAPPLTMAGLPRSSCVVIVESSPAASRIAPELPAPAVGVQAALRTSCLSVHPAQLQAQCAFRLSPLACHYPEGWEELALQSELLWKLRSVATRAVRGP